MAEGVLAALDSGVAGEEAAEWEVVEKAGEGAVAAAGLVAQSACPRLQHLGIHPRFEQLSAPDPRS